MNFIPVGDRNPLNHSDGLARVLNVVLDQLCLLRAEVGAVQGTFFLAGERLGIEPGELVKSRIELRDDLYQRIHGHITAAISGSPPAETPTPS